MFNYPYTDDAHTPQPKAYLIAEGRGKFEILDARSHTSKSGNECLKVEALLTDMHGEHCRYFMYLLPNYPLRIKYLVESIGKPHLYNAAGKLDPNELVGMEGECLIKTEKSKDPKYSDKSGISVFYAHDPVTINVKAPHHGIEATAHASKMAGWLPHLDNDDDGLPF